MKKIVFVFLLLLLGLFNYNFLTYPNFDELEKNLDSKTNIKANQINWKKTYGQDVQFDLKNNSHFSIKNIAKARLYSNRFLFPKVFDKKEAQSLFKILNDSSSYEWGETTVEYDKYLIFNDNLNRVVGLTKIDKENEFINTSPFKRTMKWGKLSKKGNSDFYKIINSN